MAQFEQPETRDVRQIVNKDQAKVEQAKALLEQDDSPASWKKVAARFSTEEATKDVGGLVEGVAAGQSEPALEEQIFSAAEGELVGPFEGQTDYYLIQVEKITPAETTPLAEVSRADRAAARPGRSSSRSPRTSSRTSSRSGRRGPSAPTTTWSTAATNFTPPVQSDPGRSPR